LREAAAAETRERKQFIGGIRLAVWGEPDAVNDALRD
jgi:hypothetical protein